MTKSAELYACLYVREFPAQALLRLRPELRERPCVVVEGDPPLEQVCALNTKARLLGIRHGMTRVEVDTCPEAVVLPRSRHTEAAVRAILLECAGAFSPGIEDCGEETCFLCVIDIAGTQSLFGPPGTLTRRLLERIRALNISARVIASRNFYAAICLAKSAEGAAVQVIPAGDEATMLSSLPLTVLDLTQAQAETFSLWGIETVGMLAALPEKELIARMGQDGKRLRQLAWGEQPHFFRPVEPPFVLEEHMQLDAPVELLDSLLFVLNLMLEQIILRAKGRILALASVTVTLSLDGKEAHMRTVQPVLPSTDKQLWLKLLHLDLEAHPPSAPILAVLLHAEPGSTNKVQLGLFSPQLPEAARLDVTLARIRAIVGEENVGRVVLEDTHAPDPYRIEPFAVLSGDSPATPVLQPRAVMRVLRPQEPSGVTLQNAKPAAFFFRNQPCRVERAYGPWRTSGNWWTGTLWGCEQWDLVARTQDGKPLYCCLTHDLMSHEWRIAGFYD